MEEFIVPLIVGAIIGFIPATIARKKGEDFFTWWLFGALLFIVALPWALIMSPHEGKYIKKCPYCAQFIKREAVLCQYCGRDLTVSQANYNAPVGVKCGSCGTKVEQLQLSMRYSILYRNGYITSDINISMSTT
ncbi:hypothetical protein AGMMS50276_08420 [Synergistales bacterium]|nr:hypothetical protein AGMMS50276_08420 [Synergistales bacterium]